MGAKIWKSCGITQNNLKKKRVFHILLVILPCLSEIKILNHNSDR